MEDELSIDSATDQKVEQQAGSMKKSDKTNRKGPQGQQHFAIEWRQLTYYQKDSRSYLRKKMSSLFCRSEPTRKEDTNTCSSESQPCGQRKRILNSLDGCFRSGQLSAILGPSGAGKTTFLSSLFGNKQEQAYGSTKVTWFKDAKHREAYGPGERPKRPIRIAFLPQHDHLLHHLSVYETLLFASKIKNAHKSIKNPRNFHKHNVRRVAKMLKLTECLETRCGKLSGGQYKRVSIGQELLSEPDVIILDEPTSGLDAMTCLTTIRTLKSIVGRHPMSIVLTIHQPDIDVFNLFDQVYVIAQGGRAIYEGSPHGIVASLAEGVGLHMPSDAYNPARFIVEHAFLLDPDEQPSQAVEEAESSSEDDSENDDDDDDLFVDCNDKTKSQDKRLDSETSGIIRRSLASLTDALAGRESPGANNRKSRLRDSGRRPLLNIGIQTADGHLITSKQLQTSNRLLELQDAKRLERYNMLKRLNELQRAKYYPTEATGDDDALRSSRGCSEPESDYSSAGSCLSSSCQVSAKTTQRQVDFKVELTSGKDRESLSSSSSSSSSGHENELEAGNKSPSSGMLSGNSSDCSYSITTTCASPTPSQAGKLRRQFDKQLSAKHNNSKQKDLPIWYHSYLLAHRTWLSISRDPVFFGIQLAMHTTIPILLAFIFGSSQEEGCPRVGNFDLVEFAYSDTGDFIHATVHSIRRSIGNIGVVFFEMFVLCFAINCITALVFPSDMFVLLKEYRNGWYSLRSYFFGRTLADLPVPVVLHSLAMTILYSMTGQPLAAWRFLTIISLVIVASLVAQSVGLTIGALLMRSSQSAVLAAAGIVAPFFALSGFIVRIHTLTPVARWAAQGSYLYHLLNGFIIMRYGFGQCPCAPEDFEATPEASSHQIPGNLRTMASMWIGTFSDEFNATNSGAMRAAQLASNRSQNIDPNIDVVEKMMNAFKMANSYGHDVHTCDDVLPYAMLDFNLRDQDLCWTVGSLVIMLLVSRVITFSAIYHKVRSFS